MEPCARREWHSNNENWIITAGQYNAVILYSISNHSCTHCMSAWLEYDACFNCMTSCIFSIQELFSEGSDRINWGKLVAHCKNKAGQ